MDMYFIHRTLRNFKDNHRYLYTAFTIFLTMVGIIIGAALAFTPIILTAFYTPLWLLSTFIIYPFGFAFFSWVFDCFDF